MQRPDTDRFDLTTAMEPVAPRVSRCWLDGGKIVWFSLEAIDREVIDGWVTAVEEVFKNWPADQPFLTIQDFSKCEGLALTSYIRNKGEHLASLRPELPGRNALVLRRSVVAQAVKMLLIQMNDKRRERRMFFSAQEAIEWLQAYGR